MNTCSNRLKAVVGIRMKEVCMDLRPNSYSIKLFCWETSFELDNFFFLGGLKQGETGTYQPHEVPGTR